MPDPIYTIFVRVPIPRGSFVDPPAVSWDSTKDEALWKILSGATHNDIDWNLVADCFEVQVDFLVQQVAFLTERHASQVRAQVRKATAAAKSSAAPSPVPGSDSTGVGNLRTASALSIRRDSPRNDGSGIGITINTASSSSRPPISRNASANTAVLRDAASASSPKTGSRPGTRPSEAPRRNRLSSLPMASPPGKSSPVMADSPPVDAQGNASPDPADSSTSSDDDSSPAQSRIIRRPPRFQQAEAFPRYQDEEDEESDPAFQRYQPAQSSDNSSHDLTSTVRDNTPNGQQRRNTRNLARDQARSSQTSDSSASSHALLSRPARARDQRGTGPVSPRRTAELASARNSRDTGSEGTLSMGSSFSDLDDTSVTQSALEEALASQINRGTASRFSISHAFRSRYTSGSHQ